MRPVRGGDNAADGRLLRAVNESVSASAPAAHSLPSNGSDQYIGFQMPREDVPDANGRASERTLQWHVPRSGRRGPVPSFRRSTASEPDRNVADEPAVAGDLTIGFAAKRSPGVVAGEPVVIARGVVGQAGELTIAFAATRSSVVVALRHALVAEALAGLQRCEARGGDGHREPALTRVTPPSRRSNHSAAIAPPGCVRSIGAQAVGIAA